MMKKGNLRTDKLRNILIYFNYFLSGKMKVNFSNKIKHLRDFTFFNSRKKIPLF